jgi:membrane fusion protein (multidrug efflux system)
VLAGLAACGRAPAEDAVEPPAVPTISATVAAATTRAMQETLTVRGTIAALPNEDVKVSALVPGRVVALRVAEGDRVTRGQVVASIDVQPFEDQRRQSTAAVAQARADVEHARANLERTQQLFAKGIAAGREVEDARLASATAAAALEQAEAALSVAARQIERAEIRSPIAGFVVRRIVSVGEQVDGTAAEPLIEVASLDRVELAASVPASQLGLVKPGQHVAVSAPAGVEARADGVVVAMAPAIDADTNAGLVRIRFDNRQHVFKVGMFAQGQVALDTHPAAVVVPPAAIVKEGDEAFVYRVVDGTATRTPVEIGLEQPDAVEILKGIAAGDRVLTSSVYGLGEKATLAKPEPER